MRVLLVPVLALFALKVLWNWYLPWWILALKRTRGPTVARRIALMPCIEAFLVLLALALSWAGNERAWPWSPSGILTLGGGLFAGSYLQMLIFGFVIRWLAARFRPLSLTLSPKGARGFASL